MTFETFFNLIFDVLGGSKSIDTFMREMFDHMLDLPADGSVTNPLYNKTGATLRKYVNVNDTQHYLPAKLVKEMHDYLEPSLFSTYLMTFSDQTRQDLAVALEPYISGVTPHNVHDECADLFKGILDDIIGLNRENEQLSLITVMASNLPADVTDTYGSRLLFETHGFCPSKSCTNELTVTTSTGEAKPVYVPTLIDGMRSASFDNLIALCPACNARYLAEQSSGMSSPAYVRSLAFYRQKKQELAIDEAVNVVLPRYQIEEGVDRLLRKIQDKLDELSDEDLKALELNYDPVKVRQKIAPDTLEQRKLLKKVLSGVREYFNLVDQTLKNLNIEQVIRQGAFSRQIKNLFIELDETTIDGEPLSQTVIFDKLVEWLHRNTDEDVDICTIVAAYFVQSCEVFYAVSE